MVDEVTGAVFEQEITGDLPANTQFLSPRLFMNDRATTAAVAYDCSAVRVETDQRFKPHLQRSGPKSTKLGGQRYQLWGRTVRAELGD
jgi:hypothetical protein